MNKQQSANGEFRKLHPHSARAGFLDLAFEVRQDDPLWLAIRRGSRSVAELFLSERARLDINCQNNMSGDTYLLAAARGGDLHLVDIILGFGGVNLNARNQQGESALEVSSRHKHDQVSQRLTGREAVY